MVTEKSCIYQNNKQTSLKNQEAEPAEQVQMKIYQSKTYWKETHTRRNSNPGEL